LAAFAVLVHHAGFDTGDSFVGRFGRIWAHGDVGVPVFFALSGFLLYRPFAKAHLANRPPPIATRFYVKRALRIVPAYWIALIGCWLLFDADIGGASKFVRYATFTQIYWRDTALGGLPQAWSLCVEVSFYAALPLLAAVIGRVVRAVGWRIGETASIGALGLIAYAYRIVLGVFDPSWKGTAMFWLPAHLDTFAIGMAIAVASVGSWRSPWCRSLVLVPVAAIAYAVVAYAMDLPLGIVELSDRQSMSRQVLYLVIAAAMVAALVLSDRPAPRGWSWAPIAWAGVLSYGVYLWHKSMILWLAEQINDQEFGGNMVLIIGLATVGSLVLAALVFFAVERPLTERGVPRVQGTTERTGPAN
jgi:peptidoglycan/LPS O-acetylase OafA/YrhL